MEERYEPLALSPASKHPHHSSITSSLQPKAAGLSEDPQMTVAAAVACCNDPLHCSAPIPLTNNDYDQSYVWRHCKNITWDKLWGMNPPPAKQVLSSSVRQLQEGSVRQHIRQSLCLHVTPSTKIFVIIKKALFFLLVCHWTWLSSWQFGFFAVKHCCCNPISLALWMEGSLCESSTKGSLWLPLCNLSKPVGLISHREQKSIHLFSKRRDKNGVTWRYGANYWPI